jgi:amino acid transporter
VRRWLSDHPTARGFAIIALIALVVVVLSLEQTLVTVGALMRIAFFLAVAFFLFLMWRERRSDIEAWRVRSRRFFYAAVAIAVVAIGLAFSIGASGPDAFALIVVLAACAWAIVRIWRDEHDFS